MSDNPEATTIRVGDSQGRGGLYNMLVPDAFERAAVVLPMVGLNPLAGSRYRLRDAWFEKDPDHGVVAHVYTRVGGNNREHYADAIDVLRCTPTYLRDADDSYDNTYASFWFQLPADCVAKIEDLGLADEPIDTGERWKRWAAELGQP